MAAINEVTDLSFDDDVAIVTVDSPPVNALGHHVREGLYQAFTEASGADCEAIVLICGGRTFIAGADIRELGTARSGPTLGAVQDAMESSGKVMVAAIHGTALGGGLEVALCAHYRIADPNSRCGLPEVKLGLLPGAGGTQRLPRIIGVERALEMITSGEHVPAPECHRMGLIDELADERSLRSDAITFARRIVAEGRPSTLVRDMKDKLKVTPGLFEEFRSSHTRRFSGFDAPEMIIRCMTAAVTLPFDEALEIERSLFEKLLEGTQSKALRYVFFAEREARNLTDVDRSVVPLKVHRVGVVGAGTMGGGITMSFIDAGIPVTVVETDPQALQHGLDVVRANYDRSIRRGRFSVEQVDERMGLVSPSLNLDDLSGVDLVVEAAFERMQTKTEIFARLNEICKPGAVLATNTSALDINEIAAVTSRPEAVIGMHFFSPANVMKLVEVVRADQTSDEVINTVMATTGRIGKVAVLVRVCPGFVGNRILAARRRAADELLNRGVMPWQIDSALRDFGFAMGPFQMSDLAGLDLGWVREESTGSTIRERLCELNRRGQKTGAGYYDYDENRRPTPSSITSEIVTEFARRSGVEHRRFDDSEIVDRLVLGMVNEGARILEEKMAMRASDIDVIWLNGYNWPRYRGGPMHWADQRGLRTVINGLEAMAAEEGPHWEPAPLLRRLASVGGSFGDA